ncbi:hypothetical protein AGMMS49975_20010 [Clostridia bacterium]|nr:hypothetical protein AGMMS49975_20010 [Clostridia bacterium]
MKANVKQSTNEEIVSISKKINIIKENSKEDYAYLKGYIEGLSGKFLDKGA